MDTSRIARKADELKTVPTMLRDRSMAMVPKRRPLWQVATLWLAGGMAIASLVAFFFDSRRGSARRHMAYDKAMATGRDVGQWGGKKVRHLRNKAMGTVAEIEHAGEPKLSEKSGS
jgi:hypothetical protein